MTTKLDGFRFKQFNIEHAGCAMKVSTDSILLGSWAHNVTANNTVKRILDVGTGSGLLAIMLAQKSAGHAQVLGIDIDSCAVAQGTINMAACPWSQRLSCQQIDVNEFTPDYCFDLIISNPPYFSFPTSDHKYNASIQNPARRRARHDNDLSLENLFAAVNRLLHNAGYFYCILPSDIVDVAHLARKHNLHCDKLTLVHVAENKPAIRQLLRFAKSANPCSLSSLTIHQASGEYSSEFKRLCADYYLNF